MGIVEAAKSAEKSIENSFKKAENVVATGFKKVGSGVKKVEHAVVEDTKKVGHAVVDEAKKLPGQIKGAGKKVLEFEENNIQKSIDFVKGIPEDITGAVSWAGKTVGGGVGSLLGGIGIGWDILIFVGIVILGLIIFKVVL